MLSVVGIVKFWCGGFEGNIGCYGWLNFWKRNEWYDFCGIGFFCERIGKIL